MFLKPPKTTFFCLCFLKEIVGALSKGVSSVYLQCLMQNPYKNLKRRWKNLESTMHQDAKTLHGMFSLVRNISFISTIIMIYNYFLI